MKRKLLLSMLAMVAVLAVMAQGGPSNRIKWKQIATGTQGQIAIVGTDGNGAWVTPVFTKWADTLTYLATKYELQNVAGKDVVSGAFGTGTGTVTITKQNGQTVTFGLDGRYIKSTEKAAANGVATLGADGIVPSNQLPAQQLSDIFVHASVSEMLGESTAKRGDFSVRTDSSKTFVLRATPASNYANWQVLPQMAGVTSVNGQAGPTVSLSSDNVNQGTTNLYYSHTLARGAFGATAPLSYNGSTGVFGHNTSGITPGTYNSITFDALGHATAGSNVAYLQASALTPYYTKTELQTAGQAQVNWQNLTNKPTNLGLNEVKQSVTGGTSAVITLSQTPANPGAVLVSLNGQLLDTADYSISGTTLTLGFTREASDVITYKFSY